MTLREAKKRRTREQLVHTALALLSERSISSVTIDELCARVEISKRTFFRYFPSKEAAVLAPLADMWEEFLDTTASRPTTGLPLTQILPKALEDALMHLPENWADRAVACLRLIEREPSLDISARALCARTTRRATYILMAANRDADSAVHSEVGLAADLVSAAFVAVQREWFLQEDDVTVGHLRELVATVPIRLDRALAKRF